MELVRHIYNCHGILVGYIVRNEHGGTFFVSKTEGEPGQRVNMGINAAHMREAFRNSGTSNLRKSFA